MVKQIISSIGWILLGILIMTPALIGGYYLFFFGDIEMGFICIFITMFSILCLGLIALAGNPREVY